MLDFTTSDEKPRSKRDYKTATDAEIDASIAAFAVKFQGDARFGSAIQVA